MEEERAVGDVLDFGGCHRSAGLHDRVRVFGVRGENTDIPDLVLRLDANEIDRVQLTAGIGNRAGKIRERSWTVLEANTKRQTEGSGIVRAHIFNLTCEVTNRCGGTPPPHFLHAQPLRLVRL